VFPYLAIRSSSKSSTKSRIGVSSFSVGLGFGIAEVCVGLGRYSGSAI
jgi:hypothetical protein